MGYIVLAKGARGIFFWTEVAATVIHVGLAVLLGRAFGLAGATMAFFGLYIWHGVLIYVIVRRMTGFRWSSANIRIGLLFLSMIAVVFSAFVVLPVAIATGVGIVAVIASALFSLRTICTLVSVERAPRLVRDLLAWSRIWSPANA
jgi:PST family polysaccharide transporter